MANSDAKKGSPEFGGIQAHWHQANDEPDPEPLKEAPEIGLHGKHPERRFWLRSTR